MNARERKRLGCPGGGLRHAPGECDQCDQLSADEHRDRLLSERWAVEKRHLIRVLADWVPDDHRFVEVLIPPSRRYCKDAE